MKRVLLVLVFIVPFSAIGGDWERLLELPVGSVTDGKTPPPGGDPRDYHSLAIYWWPNPVTGIPYLHRDGVRNPEADDFDAPKLSAMIQAVHRLTGAWRASGDERFARNAVERLRVWFLDAETRMNPNFNHAQFIPGIRDGSHHGIVEANGLAQQLIPAVIWLEEGGQLSGADARGLREWFAEFLDWLETSPNGRIQNGQPNNHGLWYDYQRIRYARFLGDEARARGIIEAVGPERIARQITAEGRMPAEMMRTRSFDYVCYALHPLLLTAAEGRELGVDLTAYRSPEGASIKQALLYAARHAADPDTWPGKQITPIRPAALVELIGMYLELAPNGELEAAMAELAEG